MRMNSSFFLAVTALAISALSVQAQTTLNTVPEGMLTLNPGSSSSGDVVTYLSLPLNADPVYTGAVSAVTATTIAVNVDVNDPAPFVNGTVGVQLANLATPALPYFVKFLSGAEAGRTIKITANTSSVLTLDTTDNTTQTVSLLTSGFAVAAGDTFEVFPAATLGSMFGDNTTGNALVLKGAASAFSADSVSIYYPTLIKFKAYFFNTNVGSWVATGTTTNANNTVIAPYGALAILRRAGDAAISISPMARESSIASVGSAAANILVPMSRVAEIPILTKTGSSAVVYGSTCYPVDMTLAQLQLGPNWIQGSSLFTVDTVSIYNTTTLKFDVYYQSTDTHWHKVGTSGTQDTVVIPAGTEVSFLQRGTVSGATSFLSSVMPYALN